MSAVPELILPAAQPPAQAFWHHFRQSKGAVVGLFYLTLVACLGILSPLIAPHSPIEQFRDAMLSPPSWRGGDARFWLGTDDLGRDMVSRLLYGARLSLFIGIAAVVSAAIPGVILGLLAAFFSRLGVLIMRLTDVILALPSLLLSIAIVAVLGPGINNMLFAIAITVMPSFIRLTRASAMSERSKDYVIASRVAGASVSRLMFVAVLPNCLAPLIVQGTLDFSASILNAAALGFLGLGAQPPTAEWGTMLASSRDYIGRADWVVTLPGLAILTTVMAINLVGDGLRDALDPRLKKIA